MLPNAAKCTNKFDKKSPKLDRTAILRKKYRIARMEVNCNWFLDRMSKNLSCHSSEIFNLLLSFFPISRYFFVSNTFSIIFFLLRDNKAQLLQATGHFYKILYFRRDSVPLSKNTVCTFNIVQSSVSVSMWFMWIITGLSESYNVLQRISNKELNKIREITRNCWEIKW